MIAVHEVPAPSFGAFFTQAGGYTGKAIPRVEPNGVSFGLMAGPDSLSVTNRKRGNPNWGRGSILPVPSLPTAFEIEVRHLHLIPDDYVLSAELRNWCERNRNRCYIPEWLLKAWGIDVDPDLSGAT